GLLQQPPGSDHARQRDDRLASDQLIEYPTAGGWPPARAPGPRGRRTRWVDQLIPGMTPGTLGMAPQRGELRLELPGQPQIVRVLKGDELAPCRAQRCVARDRRTTAVVQPEHPHAPGALERGEELPGRLLRAVVGDDELPVPERLAQYRFDGRAQQFQAVVCRQNDRDRGCHGRAEALAARLGGPGVQPVSEQPENPLLSRTTPGDRRLA